ncbi:hypothetical protein [Vibrio ishigakensis]|nr:hypothetical protein [Vibrio ishigakensis]
MKRVLPLVSLLCMPAMALAESGTKTKEQQVAQEAVNPLTTSYWIPIQYEFSEDVGPNDGTRHTTNIQPIIPFEISEDWNLITRTIIPVISQSDVTADGESESGIGDINATFFFSPDEAVGGQWTHGFGPTVNFDSASDEALGSGETGVGLSYVGLTVQGPWTVGFLASHTYSVEKGVGDTYSTTFVQPFIDYTTTWGTTFELTSETSYEWQGDEWSVPVSLTASQYFQLGDVPMLAGGGIKYWAESGEYDPEGVTLNLNLYILLPRS